MIFFQVNKTINTLNIGHQKHTSRGKDAKFIAATTRTYLFLQTPSSRRWDQPHTRASAYPAAPCAEGRVAGGTPSPTLHHPTSVGTLSPMAMSCFSSAPGTDGQEWLRDAPLLVLTACCKGMRETGKVGDHPQACQPTDPHDTKALQPRAADGWTTTVLVAFASGWGSSGMQQGATAPCSCPRGSAEQSISPGSTRLLGSYCQRYYFKSMERGAL